MLISLIVAKGNQNQIGKNNKLLWKIRDDLQNFKQLTTGHCILMGRKTFESIGKPLPNRTTLIITANKNFKKQENCEIFDCCYKAIDYAKNINETELFICGGSLIYDFFIKNNLVDKLYITNVDYDKEADKFFPKIDYNEWNLIDKKIIDKNKFNEYHGEILTLVRK